MKKNVVKISFYDDNIRMSENSDFFSALENAINEKTQWYDSTQLQKLLEQYRLLHTCVKNLYDVLEKRLLITPDPYKRETKISSIKAPDNSSYSENERAMIIGTRFSEYETMLDFIATYLKFSVENIDLQKIKRLVELNNAFNWGNFSMNSTEPNTQGLASLLMEARQKSQPVQVGVLNDAQSKSASATTEITKILKEYSDFKREEYKYTIRTKVMQSPNYASQNVHNQGEEIAEIKKNFAQTMGKFPYYSELISEIAEEDFSEIKDKLQKATLEKLKITIQKKEKKEEQIDPKTLLLETLHIITTISPLLAGIADKLDENTAILEGTKQTFFQKLAKSLKKMFGIKELPIMYRFVIIDTKTDSKTTREVEICNFISTIQRKATFFSTLANRTSPEYKKITSATGESIFQFINKQLSDTKETLVLLTAADNFFKANVPQEDRSKIKGLKMDLVTANNIILKANKKRSEYVSFIEEEEQMRKLGITNE